MNARAYFTILRPIRTLLVAAFYGWAIGFNLLMNIGSASLQETSFLTLVLIAPVLLGFYLLGPLHEVMHRNFSALLPGARKAFLRWHLRAVAVAAVLLLGAAEFCHFEFPRAASLGFVVAGLSLPLLNKRLPTPSAFWIKLILLLVVCAFAASPARGFLVEAGRAMPWVFFTAGIACAVFCFRHGFAADRIRERSRSGQPFCCFQSIAPIPGTGFTAMIRYNATENFRRASARKAGTTTREWRLSAVGNSLWSWVQVVHHAHFGGSSLGKTTLLIVGGGLLALVFPAAFFALLLNRIVPADATGVAGFWSQLADAGRIGTPTGILPNLCFGMAALMIVVMTLTFAGRITYFTPSIPLSRSRLAGCIFIEFLRILGIVTGVFAADLAILVLVAAVAAGQPLGWSLLARPAAILLLVAAATLLLWALVVLLSRFRWLSWAGILLPVLICSGIAGGFASHAMAHRTQAGPLALLDRLLTPPGLAGLLGATAVALLLCWLALRQHFRRCNLAQPSAWTARTS